MEVRAVNHRDCNGNFNPGLDTETRAWSGTGHCLRNHLSEWQTERTEPLSPPSVWGFIVPVRELW
jgi:hypothetical protein